MMAVWAKTGDHRWVDDADAGHLLLRSIQAADDHGLREARYVELHDGAVHTYVGPPVLDDESLPFGPPGVKVLTWKATQTPAPKRDDLWAMLAEIAR